MDGTPCGINKVNLRCAKDWASEASGDKPLGSARLIGLCAKSCGRCLVFVLRLAEVLGGLGLASV